MSASQDDHFTCAAMIGAADQLVAAGKLPSDMLRSGDSLVAATTHLNAWAIPKGLQEAEAFDAVKKERDRLLAEIAAEEIGVRAKHCVKSARNLG